MSEAELPEADRIAGHPHPRETVRLFGQARAEAAFLESWRSGRLHHGWLLRGPQGIGKATLAYRIARALIAAPVETSEAELFGGPAQDPVPATLDPPADCPVAARIRAGSEPGLSVLRRQLNDTGKALRTVIRVDDVRAIKGFLGLSSPDGRWRVVLVDQADEMNLAAANALLKLLEEPPQKTVILLISSTPAKLLPTIRSRCRTLDLSPLGPEDLGAAVRQAGGEIDRAEINKVHALAAGSVGAALGLIAGDGLALYDRIIEISGRGRGVDRPAMLKLADDAAGRQAETRYVMTLELLVTLLGRLARHAARPDVTPPTGEGEQALGRSIASTPAQAPIWAELAQRLAAQGTHARAVNLDPGQTIIDMFLELDAALTKARQIA